jgi:cytoskeletal protein RodZ
MNTDNDIPSLSFGRYLQSIRIEKGIKLEDVSKETRIRPETLIHIEEENHEQLPDIVFVKGFLRAYAKAVGADGDEAVRRYISRLEVIQKIDTTEVDLKRSSGVFWRRVLLSISVLFCLIAATLYGVSTWRNGLSQNDKPGEVAKEAASVVPTIEKPDKEPDGAGRSQYESGSPETAGEENLQIAAQPTNEVRNDDLMPDPPTVSETESDDQPIISGYLLQIITIEETWMKIGIDNKEPKEYNLFPGDQIELEATHSYNLRIGNAGGVKISLNGKQVDLPPKSGKVVTLKLH